MDQSNIIYEFELISNGEPTIRVSDGPQAFYMNDDQMKLDILEKLNSKWEDIGDMDPDLQQSLKSIRPKFQKILVILISIDIILSGILLILKYFVLSADKYSNIILYSFYGLILFGVIQTIIILTYIYNVMKKYQENMDKWRKLFNNQMNYYVKNILSVTYSNINTNYIISIHESGPHKLYIVLRYNKAFIEGTDDKSSILNFSEVTNNEPTQPINTKYQHKQPLLTGGNDYGRDRYQSV